MSGKKRVCGKSTPARAAVTMSLSGDAHVPTPQSLKDGSAAALFWDVVVRGDQCVMSEADVHMHRIAPRTWPEGLLKANGVDALAPTSIGQFLATVRPANAQILRLGNARNGSPGPCLSPRDEQAAPLGPPV